MLTYENKVILDQFYNKNGEYFEEYGDSPFYKLNKLLEAIREDERMKFPAYDLRE